MFANLLEEKSYDIKLLLIFSIKIKYQNKKFLVVV